MQREFLRALREMEYRLMAKLTQIKQRPQYELKPGGNYERAKDPTTGRVLFEKGPFDDVKRKGNSSWRRRQKREGMGARLK
jgi:hypothetical protein